jgi:hypothetical protein
MHASTTRTRSALTHPRACCSLLHTAKRVPVLFLDCSPSRKAKGGLTLQHTQSSDFSLRPLRFLEDFFRPQLDNQTESLQARESAACADHDVASNCVQATGCSWHQCGAAAVAADGGSVSGWSGECRALGLYSASTFPCHPVDSQWMYGDTVHYHSISASRDAGWGSHWRERVWSNGLPSHLVMFDRVVVQVQPFLAHFGYSCIHRIAHAHVSDEGNFMEIWTRRQERSGAHNEGERSKSREVEQV